TTADGSEATHRAMTASNRGRHASREKRTMIIIVQGGRNNTDRDAEYNVLEPYAQVGNILVNGGGKGWDALCYEIWTKDFQLPAVTHPAPWEREGKAAGPMRNMAIVKALSVADYADLTPDVLIARSRARGTARRLQ